MSFVRNELDRLGVTPAAALRDEVAFPHGRRVKVAGMVLVRQRPGTASGIVFVTLEDETGVANLIIRPRVFERFHVAVRHSTYILASGRIERVGPVVHLQTDAVACLSPILGGGASRSRDFH